MRCFRLRWCQTDLGAYALNWPKLISEDARFGSLAEMGSDMTPDHFDGVMAEFLVASGIQPVTPALNTRSDQILQMS